MTSLIVVFMYSLYCISACKHYRTKFYFGVQCITEVMVQSLCHLACLFLAGQQKTHETASIYNAGQQRSQPSTPNRWGAPPTPTSPTAPRWGAPATPTSPIGPRWDAPTSPVSPIAHQPGPYENVSDWQGNYIVTFWQAWLNCNC